MRAPSVDYRKLRFHNLNSPEFSHLKLLWGWVGYLLLFFLTENLIPAEKCDPVHCPLDDVVPFCEWFVIPYVSWYFLIVGSLLYFLLYNVDGFRKLQTYLILTQVIAMAVYILLPNRQDLRPEVFPRENLLSDIVGVLYAIDTNTGVCPSLHVAFSLGIASTWLREKSATKIWKAVVVIWAALICLSVAFIKQHSVVDIFAAMAMCLAVEWFVFFRKPKAQDRA